MARQLDRQHGFLAVYSMAVGAMLGTGIFVLPAVGAVSAGPHLWLSYLIAGILVIPAVLTKAELATAMPVSGGAYVYVDRAMGPWMGTVSGLGGWFSLSAKTALGLVGLGAYLVLFSELPAMAFSLASLFVLAWFNLLGLGKVSGIQKLIALASIAALVAFSYLGLSSPDFQAQPGPSQSAVSGILTGAALLFAAYAGVTKVCSIAEEVHHPQRNLPLGMLAAQLSVVALYGLVSWTIGGHSLNAQVTASSVSADPTAVVQTGRLFLDDSGYRLLAVVAVVGLISTCNAGVLSLSRLPFAMARDKLLPDRLTRVDARHHTPILSILVSTGLILALLFLPLLTLAMLASGFKLFLFCLNHLALILLRETGARWYRPTFRSPLYPWVQIFGILSSLTLLFFLGRIAVLSILCGVALATAWYFAFGRSRVTRTSAFQHLWGEAKILRNTETAELEEAMTDQAPRVIVPVFADQDSSQQLVRLGASFVELGVLEVIRLEEVPEQLHLMDQIDPSGSDSPFEEKAEEVCQDLQIALEFKEVVTHNAKQALLQHAQATNAHWLVMSWPQTNTNMRLVRNPMAWWLDHPPCDLAVFKDRGAKTFKRILVLAEPGPYDSLVTHVADRIAQQESGELLLYRVLPEETSPLDLEAHGAYHDQLGELIKSPFTSLIERSSNPIKAIAERSEGFDLLILGAHPEQALRTLLFDSFEHRVADQAHCSVLRLKTPRDLVHPRFEFTGLDHANQFELKPALEKSAVLVNSSSSTKEELFREMAAQFNEESVAPTDAILAALWQRERFQSTALTGNVALMAATSPAIQRTWIGVVTCSNPVDFRGPGQRSVDCFFSVVAHPRDRRHQLWLLTQLARMTLRSDFLPEVRDSDSPAELRKTLVRFAGNGLL